MAEPTIIQYSPKDSVQLVVTQADNLLVGYLNEDIVTRRQVYGRMTDYAISFKDTIDIGSQLRVNNQVLSLVAANFGGGGGFKFQILVNGTARATVSTDIGSGYSSASWAYQFQQ